MAKSRKKKSVGWINEKWYLHSCPMNGSLDNIYIIDHPIIHRLRKTHHITGQGKPIKVEIIIKEV